MASLIGCPIHTALCHIYVKKLSKLLLNKMVRMNIEKKTTNILLEQNKNFPLSARLRICWQFPKGEFPEYEIKLQLKVKLQFWRSGECSTLYL